MDELRLNEFRLNEFCMDEFFLYVAVPDRKHGRIIDRKLADILGKTRNRILHLTWIMEGSRAGYLGVHRVLKRLRRMEKDRGKRVVINTMEFRAWRSSALLLLRGLSLRRFRMVFRLEGNTEKAACLAQRMNRRGLSAVYEAGSGSDEAWLSWLRQEEYTPAEPWLDYLKICMGGRATACRYRSCLGKTLYLDREGRWGICPYRENTIPVRDPAECRTPDELIQTREYIALLEKQVRVRGRCASACRYYPGCQGGCPLQPEAACPEPELLRALQAAEASGIPDACPAKREEEIEQLAGMFTV